MTLDEKASRVRLLLFDVDGVLTDGTVVMHADGSESKGFHIRDGAAIVWAQRAGLAVGLLSARSSGARPTGPPSTCPTTCAPLLAAFCAMGPSGERRWEARS